jgi:hypothetical protein
VVALSRVVALTHTEENSPPPMIQSVTQSVIRQ